MVLIDGDFHGGIKSSCPKVYIIIFFLNTVLIFVIFKFFVPSLSMKPFNCALSKTDTKHIHLQYIYACKNIVKLKG